MFDIDNNFNHRDIILFLPSENETINVFPCSRHAPFNTLFVINVKLMTQTITCCVCLVSGLGMFCCFFRSFFSLSVMDTYLCIKFDWFSSLHFPNWLRFSVCDSVFLSFSHVLYENKSCFV